MSLMVIDFHTHCFPDSIAAKTIDKLSGETHTKAFSDGTARSLLSIDKEAGIDLSVIMPIATDPAKVERINDRAATYNDGGPLMSFACIHPDHPDPKKELKRVLSMGFRGIKLHSFFQVAPFDDIRNLRIVSLCAELGLIVLAHAGQDMGFPGMVCANPEMIRSVVLQAGKPQKDGDYQFIAAHMGGWGCWERVPDVLEDTGVMIDTSTSVGTLYRRPGDDTLRDDQLPLLDAKGFMKIYNAFGPERMVFASDSPWTDAKESLDFLKALPIGSDDLELILGKNAEKLLKL